MLTRSNENTEEIRDGIHQTLFGDMAPQPRRERRREMVGPAGERGLDVQLDEAR